MSTNQWIGLALNASIMLMVLSVGLRASTQDALHVLRRPALLARSLVSLFVVMPVFAVVLALIFDLNPAVRIALVALSISPVPPIIPKKALKAGGRQDYTIGLMVAGALASVILIPLILTLLSGMFGLTLSMSVGTILKVVGASVLAPLALGILIHSLSPGLSMRAAGTVGAVSFGILIICVILLIAAFYKDMADLIGDGTLASMVAFCLVGLIAGSLLAGSDRSNRIVLAFCTCSRHPGVAIAIAQANYPNQNQAPAAILLFLLVNLLVSVIYMVSLKRGAAGAGARPAREEGGPGGLKPA